MDKNTGYATNIYCFNPALMDYLKHIFNNRHIKFKLIVFYFLTHFGDGMKIYDFNGNKNICGRRVKEAGKKLKLPQENLSAKLQTEGININSMRDRIKHFCLAFFYSFLKVTRSILFQLTEKASYTVEYQHSKGGKDCCQKLSRPQRHASEKRSAEIYDNKLNYRNKRQNSYKKFIFQYSVPYKQSLASCGKAVKETGENK